MKLKHLPLLLLAPTLAMAQTEPSPITVSALDELQVSQKNLGHVHHLGAERLGRGGGAWLV
jgi:hypothetical protein